MVIEKKEDIFNVKRIRELVELMKENDIDKIDIQQGTSRVCLRRGHDGPVYTTVAPMAPPAAPVVATAPGSAPASDDSHIKTINSPMVGKFYITSKPDAPPFVKVGDTVHPAQTVCIIEAMKVFSEIPAEMDGKIVAIMAKNGDVVDFGRPLFKIDTRG